MTNLVIVLINHHRLGTLVRKVPDLDIRHAGTPRAAPRRSSVNALIGAAARAREGREGLRRGRRRRSLRSLDL